MKKYIISIIALFMLNIASYAQNPNVLIFLIDDLRDELGCYGSETAISPNIDKLASEGVMFNKAYCQQAICAPSRMSILTGLRPETFGIFDIFTKFRNVHPDVVTMPQLFKENGYKTVSIGKVYHHGVDDKANWTSFERIDDRFYAEPSHKDAKWSNDAGDVNDEFYKDGMMTNKALDELDKLNASKDKFLMVVGLTKPHLPFNAPKKYWDLYNRNNFKIPQKEKPTNMPSYSLSTWGELRGYDDIPAEGNLDDAKTRELIHGYHACVSYTDALVGKIMKRLDDLDLRKNTMVIFMSDHGYKIGEYSSWCKHSCVELDEKVPLIISRETSYSKRKAGVMSDALVENIDIFPTIIETCGLVPPKMDGKSLVQLIDNPEMEWDSVAYGLYNLGTWRMSLTATDGKWRYTEHRDYKTNKVVDKELYLHDISPIAQANLAGMPVHINVQKRMKDILDIRFPTDTKSYEDVPFIGNNKILDINEAEVTAPANNANFTIGQSVQITANATATFGIEKVVFRLNGSLLSSVASAPYTTSWTPQTPGSYTINVESINSNGKITTSSSITININSIPIPPTLTFSVPPGNISLTEGYDLTAVVNATDMDGSIHNVKLYIDNKLVRQDYTPPYEWGHDDSPNPHELNGLAPGLYEIKAIATDNQGLIASASITLTVVSDDNEQNTTNLDINAVNPAIGVYPNPTNSSFKININGIGATNISIYNTQGQQVYHKITSTENLISVPLKNIFTKGIYLIRVTDKNQHTYIKKLVIK